MQILACAAGSLLGDHDHRLPDIGGAYFSRQHIVNNEGSDHLGNVAKVI
jgi:hypothetical protein